MRKAVYGFAALALLGVAGCRTATYDERMQQVDELYTAGSYVQAEGELAKQTDGRVGTEPKVEE